MNWWNPRGKILPCCAFCGRREPACTTFAYEVEDLERGMAEMKTRGAIIARRPKPAVAFQGRRIAWMLTAEKLLVELLEIAAKA